MIKELSIDLETYSDVDISKCGAYKYAESDNFEILLFGVSVDNGPVIANFPCFSYSNQKQEPKRPFFCRGSCNFIIISILKMQ